MMLCSHIADIEDYQEEFNDVAVKTILSDDILTLPSEEREDLLYEVQNLRPSDQSPSGEFNFAGRIVKWSLQSHLEKPQALYISLV